MADRTATAGIETGLRTHLQQQERGSLAHTSDRDAIHARRRAPATATSTAAGHDHRPGDRYIYATVLRSCRSAASISRMPGLDIHQAVET